MSNRVCTVPLKRTALIGPWWPRSMRTPVVGTGSAGMVVDPFWMNTHNRCSIGSNQNCDHSKLSLFASFGCVKYKFGETLWDRQFKSWFGRFKMQPNTQMSIVHSRVQLCTHANASRPICHRPGSVGPDKTEPPEEENRPPPSTEERAGSSAALFTPHSRRVVLSTCLDVTDVAL